MFSNPKKAIQIIKEIPTDGHSPLLVMANDFELYVAKNDKGKNPAFALINECLASYFLNLWGLPTPLSDLIWVPKELIKEHTRLSQNHKLHYYDIPCFGSKFIQNSIDLNSLTLSKSKKFFNRLLNPIDVFHITLFDTWVENDDRKPTNYNLIFKAKDKKYTILPIDNAYIFSTMSYKDLDPKHGVAVSANEHLLVSELGFLIKEHISIDDDFIEKQKDYFYFCIDKCKQSYDDFINQITDHYFLEQEIISSLNDFLFDDNRNNKVFNEYVYRLHQ